MINFDDLNKEINKGKMSKNIQPEQVKEVMKILDELVIPIKKDIITFVKDVNRATMKAKDLDPYSDEFQIQVDKMQKALNGVIIYTGSLMPYQQLKKWMEKMQGLIDENKS